MRKYEFIALSVHTLIFHPLHGRPAWTEVAPTHLRGAGPLFRFVRFPPKKGTAQGFHPRILVYLVTLTYEAG
jgi:hypothetical protein